MALMDILEALAASYKRGEITLDYMVCVTGADGIAQLFEWCRYFNIDMIGMEHLSVLEVQRIEKSNL